MIGYLEGRIIRHDPEGILLLAGAIGFEVLLSPTTLAEIQNRAKGENQVSLYIYYHVAERQPKPILIGFATPGEKAFFQLFITVSAIGPMKAVKAMIRPAGEIALAIEQKDVSLLSQLPGIGKRTAEKIIATLHGKTQTFIPNSVGEKISQSNDVSMKLRDVVLQVTTVLVEQLGHTHASAQRMIKEAMERDSGISTPEALFDEIYRENR